VHIDDPRTLRIAHAERKLTPVLGPRDPGAVASVNAVHNHHHATPARSSIVRETIK
jgi:hypothetical protein